MDRSLYLHRCVFVLYLWQLDLNRYNLCNQKEKRILETQDFLKSNSESLLQGRGITSNFADQLLNQNRDSDFQRYLGHKF